jgi:plastocyanin
MIIIYKTNDPCYSACILFEEDLSMRASLLSLAGLLLAFSFTVKANAEDYVLTIKDKQFSPSELMVPVGQKIKLIVKNTDPTPAEFESSDLNREKLVTAGNKIIIYIGPLDAGRYNYFNDFNRDTKGTIVAK